MPWPAAAWSPRVGGDSAWPAIMAWPTGDDREEGIYGREEREGKKDREKEWRRRRRRLQAMAGLARQHRRRPWPRYRRGSAAVMRVVGGGKQWP